MMVLNTRQFEDLVGTIFISLSKRGGEVNRFMDLPIYEYIEELLDGKGIRQFALTSGKV